MNAFVISVGYLLIWRLAVLTCGLVSVVLGYKLFRAGFAAPGGQLEAGVAGNTLKLGQAAPGTFFALFGAAIIATLVWSSPPEIVIPKDSLQATGTVEQGRDGIKLRSD